MHIRLQRFLILFFIVFLTACSVKKDSFKNRSYHQLTSWFNTLFNGQEAIDSKMIELKSGYQDDYFTILRVEPYPEFRFNEEATEIAPPDMDESLFNKSGRGSLQSSPDSKYSGFEKAEEKALKAISNHSMVFRNEEKNKLMSRAYLMLGQARYYQGKTFPAIDALTYADKYLSFEKHKPEARYFIALSQMQAGNKYAAAEILQQLYDDKDLDKGLKENVAKHYAWLFIQEKDYISALNGLDVAIENARKKEDEARYNFIQGQLLSSLKRYDEAHDKFMRVFKLKPGFEMEARSQTAIAANFDPAFDNYSAYEAQMEKMAKTGTYETYRNEFYYATGLMNVKRDSLKRAETYFRKSLAEKISDPRYRGETFAAMGDLKFRASDYVYAGAYYDSAVSILPESPRKTEFTRFRDDLKSITDKYYLVKRNDSILALAAMPEAERETFFRNYIEELKLKDEAKRKEQEENQTIFATETKESGFANTFDEGGKFYFYSSAAKSQGETDFRRIWGDIQLRDNWRVSTTGTSIEAQKAELTGTQNLANPRRYELDFYLEQIPDTQAELHRLKMERDTTELSLGIDYFDKFKDRKLATQTLEHLVESPPKDPTVELKAYYNLYRVNNGVNAALEEKYKNLVLTKYPNTVYAEYILNPNVEYFTENTSAAAQLYSETFAAYEAEDFALVKELSLRAMNDYPTDAILAKFSLLNAYADAKLSGVDAYRNSLERTVVLFEGTAEAEYAQYLLDRLNGKKVPVKQAPQEDPNIRKAKEEEMKKEETRKQEMNAPGEPPRPRMVPDMSDDDEKEEEGGRLFGR